jgi:hypothetical protein
MKFYLLTINFMAPVEKKRQECIVYSRVVGWLTPVKNWNSGKRAEWDERVPFNANKGLDK